MSVKKTINQMGRSLFISLFDTRSMRSVFGAGETGGGALSVILENIWSVPSVFRQDAPGCRFPPNLGGFDGYFLGITVDAVQNSQHDPF